MKTNEIKSKNMIPPGLEKAYEDLSLLLRLPLQYQKHFNKLNIECPKGVLLFGPPGVGKTFLVQSLAQEMQASMISISGPEIYSPYPGESEFKLRQKFNEAKELSMNENNGKQTKPCIVFIDEIDALTPARSAQSNTVESRVVAQLLTLMDGLEHKNSQGDKELLRIVVIAATNRPNHIDPALRRPGRFDREVYIDVPNVGSRLKILLFCTKDLKKQGRLSDKIDFELIAKKTVGYVGADLAMLSREATFISILDSKQSTNFIINSNHFEKALQKVLPSLQRHESSIQIKDSKFNWDSLAGIDHIKKELQMSIEWPIKYPYNFNRLGLKPPRGILLFGPPGCSKTSLVRVIAATSNLSMFTLHGASIYSCYVGESEATIRNIFERARRASPSLIFIDEIDALIGKRGDSDVVQERILTMLLNEMDGVQEAGSILVIGATNRPDKLDSAIMRPGRFDKKIYVEPPNQIARQHIFSLYCKQLPIDDNIDFCELAKITNWYSGSDIRNLCREAAFVAIREFDNNNLDVDQVEIQIKHFYKAMESCKPSLNPQQIEPYLKFLNQELK